MTVPRWMCHLLGMWTIDQRRCQYPVRVPGHGRMIGASSASLELVISWEGRRCSVDGRGRSGRSDGGIVDINEGPRAGDVILSYR